MLSGIRVLSFTHFLQGPSAAQLLSDMGAEVIKVESPTGAFERSWSGPDAYVNDVSVFFLLGNRNNRSISINLKSPAAQGVLHELVRSADVLVENFRPGAMERLGLSYATLREINPRLVYASLTGYGPDGPYKDRPGQDVLLQAMSGLAAATGGASAPPTPVGASIVDQHGAVLGAMGILAALMNREKTGEGSHVESNLLSAALDLQIEPLAYHLNGYRGQRSRSNISSTFYKAPYGVFETADGFICLSLSSPAVLSDLLNDKSFDEISADQEHAKREIINDRVAFHLRTEPTAHWEELFTQKKIWFAPVNDYDAVINNPQVIHNGNIIELDHPEAGQVRVLGHPVSYNGQRPAPRTVPPLLGEQTLDILQELGLDEGTVNELISSGAVKAAEHV